MIACLLPDIHSKWYDAESTYKDAVSRAAQLGYSIDLLIQVGDFGYWPRSVNKTWDREFDHPCYFICGNHEDFESLVHIDEPNLGLDPYHSYSGQWTKMMRQWDYKSRGTIEDGILFIGGARSIDRHWRIEGLDWFPEENISCAQQEYILDQIEEYGAKDIHTVISHDAPTSFVLESILSGPEYHDGNRKFLEEVRRIVEPERWYFGHYHRPISDTTHGTYWECVGIVDNRDFLLISLP